MIASGKRYIWHDSRTDEFRIWNLSDLHIGARGCAENDLRRDVAAIAADPFSFWFGGGDYGDFIGHRDKRFDPNEMAEWLKVKDLADLGRVTMARVRDILAPIGPKCLGLLIGNHEVSLENAGAQDSLHHWLCQELNAPFLGYCAFVDLAFCRTTGAAHEPVLRTALPPRRIGALGVRHSQTETIRFFLHHGAGAVVTPGGKLNRLISAMESFDADVYMLGHVHDQMARRQPAIAASDDCSQLIERVRLGMISGSYLKTYQQDCISYGERKMYKPTNLGAAVCKIKPAGRVIEAVI